MASMLRWLVGSGKATDNCLSSIRDIDDAGKGGSCFNDAKVMSFGEAYKMVDRKDVS